MLRNWYIRENVKYVSILLIVSLFYSMFFPSFVRANTATATEQLKRDTGKGAWGFQDYPQKKSVKAIKKQRISDAPPAGAGHFPGFTVDPTQRTVKAIKKRRTSVSKSATQSVSSSGACAIGNLCVPEDRARMLVPCTEDAESNCSEDTELWMASYAYAFQDNNYLEIRASYKNVTNDETFHQTLCFAVNEETTLGQIESITLPAPESLSDAFGADGILYPGETTTVLTFKVKHKGRAFSFFVDANAVVEGIVAPSPTPTVLPSPSLTPVATPTHLPSPPPTVTPVPTPTPTPIIIPKPTVIISANPETIIQGETTTLTWSSTHATSAEIDQGIGAVAVNGSLEVSPTQTTTYTITATGDGGTANASVTVDVTIPVENHPPKIISQPFPFAMRGEPYGYDAEARDPDRDDVLTFSLDAAPDGMIIDAGSGLISWMPTQEQIGTNEARVRVKDQGGLFDTQAFTIIVASQEVDLTISSIDASSLAFDGQALTVSGNITAEITNNGPEGIVVPYDVLFFEDVNFNKSYDAAVDNVLGSVNVVEPLAAAASVTVTAALSGSVRFSGAPIWGYVDSENRIPETDEENNLLRSGSGCQVVSNDAPDIIPSYVQVSEGGSSFIITARIGNAGVVTVGPGVSVAFYDSDPKNGGTLLGTAKTTTYIDPGTYEDVSFTVSAAVIQNLFVSADDDGTLTGTVSECNELNNIYDWGKGVIVPSNHPPEITSEPVTELILKQIVGDKEIINLSTWDIVQYKLNDQGDASWVLDETKTVAVQTRNADPSIFLSDFVLENNKIEGNWRVNIANDDDFVGFVFGYQDSEHFYLFDWKQSDQHYVVLAERGMSVKIINANTPLTFYDLWPTVGSEGRVSTIFHNRLGWEDFKEYHFTLEFYPGEFTITVKDGETILESVTLFDDTYTTGGFGFYNYSQDTVEYRGFLRQTLAERSYVYDVEAIDQDDDSLTFSLVTAPDGMTIDSITGKIIWHVTSQNVGEHSVTVRVDDGKGLYDEQSFILVVLDTNPPEITSPPITEAFTDETYAYDVEATDADGDVLSYSLVTFPENMSIDGSSGLITWVPNADQVGDHAVEVRVEDGKSGSDSQTFTITVNEGTTTGLTVSMHAHPASIIVGGTSTLTWTSTNATSAEMNQGIGSVAVNGSREVSPTETTTYIITATGDEGTASSSATVVVNSTATVPDVVGMSQAEAEASITAAGLVVGDITEMSTADVSRGRVFNQNPRGGSVVSAHAAVDISVSLGIITTDPKVTLISPEPHADIKSPTDIIVTITDSDPLDLTWETRFAPVGTQDFRVIGSGAGTVNAAPVGRFDPTLLANDTYRVEINWKKGPRTGGIFFYYSVSGNLKVGNFRLEFVDLQIPLAGIPITIKRVYDTLDLRKGDFGVGWTLGYPGAVRDSTPEGEAFSLRSRVYVTMPDGRRIGFQFAPVQVSPWFPFIFKTAFKPDPGVYDTLSVDEAYVMHSAGYFYTGLFTDNFNPNQYTLTTKDGAKYLLHEQDGLLRVEDLNGNILTVEETGITHSSGTTISFVRDSEGRIKEIVDPDGNSITYEYDPAGNLIKKTDQEGLATTFTYYDTPAHFLREIFDPLGRMAQRTEYDENGRVIAVYDPLGNKVEQDYNPENFLTTQTDRNGNVSEYLYDQNGNVLEIRNPLGGIKKFAYDDPNNPYRETTITDENGNTTSYTYDTQGNMLTKTDAEGNTATLTYSKFGNITSIEDPLGRLTTFRYDDAGNLTELINPLGLGQKFTRDSQGRITTDTDFNGHVTTFDYTGGCSCGKPGKIIYPDGSVKTFEYNRYGQITRTIDETGAQAVFTYDNLGREISEIDHEGNAYTSTYNAHLLVSKADPLNRTTTFEYDGADNLIKQTDALGGVTQFTYDANGNRTSVTDPVNNKTDFVYDELNRLVKRIDPLGNTTTYAYDAVGNRTEQIDRNGRKSTYEYDNVNRLAREHWHSNDSIIRSIGMTYDKAGNQLFVSDADSSYAFAYDTLSRVEQVDNHGTIGMPRIILTYRYDNNGNLVSTEDNLGTRVAAEYNPRNFLTRRTWSGSAIDTARVDYRYNERGDRVRVDKYRDHAGNQNTGVSTFEVNEIGVISTITHFNNTGSRIAEYTYGYDAARQLVNETHHGQTSSYEYDQTGQLVEAHHSTFDDESYRYDANGNRTSSHRHGSDYVTGANNQLLSDGDLDYAYDNEGNLVLKTARSTGNTTSYTYDHRNRLTNVVEKTSDGTIITQVEFGYDVLNRRIKKSVNGDVVYTAYNFENAWADFDASGRVLANYFFGDRIDENIARYRPGEGTSWYQTDKLGTIRDVSNSSGNTISHVDYDSFGNVLGVTDSTAIDRYRFTGREFDEGIGLYDYRARAYSSLVGRFASLDPIGFEGKDFNLYRYVKNNPMIFTDPSGESLLNDAQIIQLSFGVIGALVGVSSPPECANLNDLEEKIVGGFSGFLGGLFLGTGILMAFATGVPQEIAIISTVLAVGGYSFPIILENEICKNLKE